MTTALAPVVHMDELEVIQRTGKMLAASGYFDAKGDGPQAVAMMATKILAGREIGIGPFAAVNGIHIISGKPAIGANLMASAVKGSGRYDYRVREISDKACRIEFFQRSGDQWESIGTSEFTADDARKAQTKNMDKFARNMLFARAMSNGIRWYCPDVFSGNAVYVPEELGATVDGDGNVVDVDVRRVDAPQLPAPAPEPIDNPFDKEPAPARPVADATALKRLNTVGRNLYGAEWDTMRPQLVEWISKGAVKSSKDLTPNEVDTLIAKIERKAAQAAAAIQSAQSAQPELAA